MLRVYVLYLFCLCARNRPLPKVLLHISDTYHRASELTGCFSDSDDLVSFGSHWVDASPPLHLMAGTDPGAKTGAKKSKLAFMHSFIVWLWFCNAWWTAVVCYFSLCFAIVTSRGTMNVGPCHHGMARPQVADGGTASYMGGSCE
jgi:hypothetical protein